MRYTLQDFSDLGFLSTTYTLPQNVISNIKLLMKELGPLLSQEVNEDNDVEHSYKKTNHFSDKRGKNENRFKNKIDESWKQNNIPFKATKIEKKENGIDKTINDIRVVLNKISNKNYESQRDIVFQYIQDIVTSNSSQTLEDSSKNEIKNKFDLLSELEEENDYLVELDLIDYKQIIQSIFEVAISNSFYSEIYATLFKELLARFPIMIKYLDPLLDYYTKEYYDNIDSIVLVDSEKDYDQYCQMNKFNDKRKSFSTFVTYLTKEQVLLRDQLFELIIKLQNKIIEFVDLDGNSHKIDVIIENLFILITLDIDILKENKCENVNLIIDNIQMFSGYKAKDHKSITSRSIFKLMDIKDVLKKSL